MLIAARSDNPPLVVFNPSPIRSGLPLDLYAGTDVIKVNDLEAEALSGQLPVAALIESLNSIANVILDRGVPHADIITLGSSGSYLLYRSTSRPKIFRCFQVERVEVLDSSGAGDAYSGVLCAMLSKNIHIEEACEIANRVASITVRTRGCQESYPKREKLDNDSRNFIARSVSAVRKRSKDGCLRSSSYTVPCGNL